MAVPPTKEYFTFGIFVRHVARIDPTLHVFEANMLTASPSKHYFLKRLIKLSRKTDVPESLNWFLFSIVQSCIKRRYLKRFENCEILFKVKNKADFYSKTLLDSRLWWLSGYRACLVARTMGLNSSSLPLWIRRSMKTIATCKFQSLLKYQSGLMPFHKYRQV